jgi:broad specificity phosphatase PhoE
VTELVFVRHGRTEINATGRLQGRLDASLDELGERQARALAAEVRRRSDSVAAVVSSPLRRALQTAAAFGAPIEVDERFVELDYGDLDGVRLTDVPAETWTEWRSDTSFRPPGGESLLDLGIRVRLGCEDWASRGVDGAVVIVSHVSPIKAAVAWALGVGDEVSWRMRLDPASITRIVADAAGSDVRPSLHSFNEGSHLLEL